MIYYINECYFYAFLACVFAEAIKNKTSKKNWKPSNIVEYLSCTFMFYWPSDEARHHGLVIFDCLFFVGFFVHDNYVSQEKIGLDRPAYFWFFKWQSLPLNVLTSENDGHELITHTRKSRLRKFCVMDLL